MFNLYYNAFKKELMNIVLVGYMGSGKSAIGTELANYLNLKFIDLDHYIEKKEGKSINRIFEESGDIYFRNIETKYLKMCLKEFDKIVLSLGGGTPCYNNNLKYINLTNNFSVYLKITNTKLAKRLIENKHNRPLVSDIDSEDRMIEFVSKHLFEREIYYKQTNLTIECSDRDIKTICDMIIYALN